MLDEFYPMTDSLKSAVLGNTVGTLGLEQRLRSHLSKAVLGDRAAESRLVNRVGQIRRCAGTIDRLDPGIRQAMRESVAWLRVVGRECDLSSPDPAKWVSKRGGAPRW